MSMDAVASQMVAWSRLVETALHDSGPWTFRTLHGVTTAHRQIDPDLYEISFTGATWGSGTGTVELWCQDRFVTLIHTPQPLAPGDALTWTLTLHRVARI